MGINNQTVAVPLIFPRQPSRQDGAPFLDTVVEAVARASEGLLPPPFWMNVVLTATVCHSSVYGTRSLPQCQRPFVKM